MSARPTPPKDLPDPENVREVLGYWVRLFRAKKDWSQEKLAMECGLDRTYVSAVERGRWNVSLSNIERFAKVLDVPVWVLLSPAMVVGAPPCRTTIDHALSVIEIRLTDC